MASKSTITYEAVPSGETTPHFRNHMQRMFRFKESIRWYVLGIWIYGLAGLGVLAWALTCPSIGNGRRVLQTGDLKVDQLLSGLALSAIFAPAGIMVRRVANDLALFHPFAMASRKNVKVMDLDRLMEPGLLAVLALAKCSVPFAIVQACLIVAGALMVPVATLLVSTGNYTVPATGIAVVGQPTLGDGVPLGAILVLEGCDPTNLSEQNCSLAFGWSETFLPKVVQVFQGNLIRENGQILDIPNPLGPSPTSNLTLLEGVSYEGIISYHWSSKCEVTDEITFTKPVLQFGDPSTNFTFPDGSTISASGITVTVNLWSNSKIRSENSSEVDSSDSFLLTPSGLPIGGTTYFAIAGDARLATNAAFIKGDAQIIDGLWISRVKCKPEMHWEVSKCTFRGSSMTDCTAAPGSNTTELSEDGLNALTLYIDAALWTTYYNIPVTAEYQSAMDLALTYDPTSNDAANLHRIPTLADYEKLYGSVVQAIVFATSSGFYGTAEVPTSGSTPKLVYIIRMYILALVLATLLGVPILTTGAIVAYTLQNVPIRRATFLTIATAVRGAWWDTVLWDGNKLSADELRKRHKEDVMFGVSAAQPHRVGFGPAAEMVERRVESIGL